MPSNAPAAKPSLAVVICTKDRPESLRRTLESIWSQSTPPEELIIIDDGQLPAQAIEQIHSAAARQGLTATIQKNPRTGLTAARNYAADIARSECLVYLDDDVDCDRDLLREISRLMSDRAVAGVTATVVEPAFDSPAARLFQFGYRVAAWWRVSPRGLPPAPRPSALADPAMTVRARWLSGAAMALRRDVLRKERFDETLTQYALGEDREMGYRLAPHYWLLESRRAKVIHRRESTQRTDSRRFGFMTSRNYLYILEKTCRPGIGEWTLIAWSLAILMLMHAAGSLVGDRRAHLLELLGMLSGIRAFLRERYSQRELPLRTKPSVESASSLKPQVSRLNPRRRVLFVTNRLEPGGAELMLVGLVRHLPAAGIDPIIVCLKDAGPLAGQCRDAGIPVFDRLLHHKYDAAAISRITETIAENRIDAVIVAHSGGDRMFWSTLAATLADTPVVVWSHWFPRGGIHHFERPNRLLFRWVDRYVALGERHRRALIRHEQVPTGRITVIPNALDLARFMQLISRRDARQRLRLSENQIGVGIIANLRPEKRHDVFIEAARTLSQTDPNLRFFIIGDGPSRDAVQAAAAASGLDHEILRWMGTRDDVPDLLSGLDIACLCSEIECFSVNMLEAAAARCAFIGPNTGCLPEFLEHRRTGLLIRPADPVGLADAIAELAGDAGLRHALADAAHDRVIQKFGLEAMARKFSELIRCLPVRRRRNADSPQPPRLSVRSFVPIS